MQQRFWLEFRDTELDVGFRFGLE